MNLFVVLILSLISVLFLLVGTLIVFKSNNNEKIVTFSVSLGFVVLVLLGILHLLPDGFEFFLEKFDKVKSSLFLLLFSFLGFGIVFLFDRLGGHHDHNEKESEEHFHHISVITCIFLVIHNFIEGMTIYSSALINYKTAVILTLGIGLHNIPLGFTLASTFNKICSKLKTVLYIIFIGISYLFGALVAYKFSDVFMSPIVLGIALSFTFGMILYIAIFEFLPLINESNQKKTKVFGVVLGFVLMLFTLFL